ncbi:MAG: NAD-dependent succinate-semialdehyde dehydrogenase [Chitinophagaceae bacterium]
MPAFTSIFPFNQQKIAEYLLMNETEIEQRITNAEKTYINWKEKSFQQRADVLLNVAAILKRDKESFAELITHEMGKIISEAKAEIEKCAWVCEFYAQKAEAFLKDEIVEASYYKSFITYEPIGAVLAIMPWNFPFWQVFRFAAPTLMAGNVALLKHAPNVCGCSLAIEKIFQEAGAEKGVFQSLIIDTPQVPAIIEQKIVQAVTLTGSEFAGGSVASLAGGNIKKSVLELGGSDACIILKDADIKKAATIALQSRMQNAGQSCIAAKRFIVEEKIISDFLHEIFIQIKKIKQGNPFEKEITMGPMARLDLAENLSRQIQQSIKSGAILEFGGNSDGCNFSPSLLTNIFPGMAAFEEETFGPLAAIVSVKNENEAIALANQSKYGLAGSIWTNDIEKGIALSRKINSGALFINSLVKSDPNLPFGGIKKSGYGRELGYHGIREFTNIKTIVAQQTEDTEKEVVQ